MRWQSALAIYFLFWFLAVFLVLPFGMRTSEEAGEAVAPGHAESAPHRFDPWRIMTRTTIVASIMFGLFYANYIHGWITVDMLDWVHHEVPPDA
jgi:predicted secreted protein